MANTPTIKIRDSKTGRLRQVTDLDRDRLRFNWGYHDAAWEWKHHQGPAPIRYTNGGPEWMDNHHDPIYVKGYVYGMHDAQAGTYGTSSEGAWKRAVDAGIISSDDSDHCSDYRRVK